MEGKILLVICVVVISVLALVPPSSAVPSTVSDKILHFLAFYVLSLLVDFAFPKTRFGVPKISALVAYGVLIEITQLFFSYRQGGSLGDLLANVAGIFCYLVSIPILRRLPVLRERWYS